MDPTMSSSNYDLESYNNLMTTSSFTDLLNSNVNDLIKPNQCTGSDVPKFNFLLPPSLSPDGLSDSSILLPSPNEQSSSGENQQQSWNFVDQNKQDDQFLNSTKTMINSEFTVSQYDLESYNALMTTSSFTDLLNSNVNDSTKPNHCTGSDVPKFDFLLPPSLSPDGLLDSSVLLSSPNVLPSPTTGRFVAQASNWKSNTNNDVIDNINKEEDVYKYSDFNFQTQGRPNNNDVSSIMFQSSMPLYTNEQSLSWENQQQTWNFVDQNKQDDQYLNSTKTMVNSEFTTSQYESSNQETIVNFEPAQYKIDCKTSEDGYKWKKRGEKLLKGGTSIRTYYQCTFKTCTMRKKVGRTLEGDFIEMVYEKGTHNHPKPINTKRSSFTSFQTCVSPSNNSSIVIADKDVDMIFQSCGSGSAGDDFGGDEPLATRLTGEVKNVSMSAARWRKAMREPRVVIQTTSDIDILDDGYRWKKYGQKVVTNNPNPRSYFKCTHPICPVKKHIERAAHDQSQVITTYICKHNHKVPAARAGPNNEEMSSMALRLPATTYDIGSNPAGNGHTFLSNQGVSFFEGVGAGTSYPSTLQMLQNPESFGYSEYLK